MNPWEKFDNLEQNIRVEMIQDSFRESNGARITTMLWHVPRFVLPQLNTYRQFSRNVSSCLTGSNKLYFDLPAAVKVGKKHSHYQTIDELYRKWTYGDALGKNHKNVIRNMHLRTLEKDGSFGHTHIKDIRYEGIKSVYKVTLKNGKQITLTSDHRMMTEDGWKKLDDFGLIVHNNMQCSWFNKIPKISTNGQEITYELLSVATLDGVTSTELAKTLNVNTKELEKHALNLGVALHKRQKDRGEISSYRFKHVLEYHISKRHNSPTIASMYGTSVDKVKKIARKFDLKFDFINRDGFTPWNKGKTYEHTDENKIMFRRISAERAAKKVKIADRTGYATDKNKITTWLNSIRFNIYKKFNYSCYLCTSNQNLELHHIQPVALRPELACDENNICLLCRYCHKDIHRNFIEEQFAKFYLGQTDDIEFVKQTNWMKTKRKGNELLQTFSEIINIEYQGEQKVFDIEVEAENESFVCNGIVVHNSRAKRFSKTLQEVLDNPYMPHVWQKDHKGMQGDELLEEWKIPFVEFLWKLGMWNQATIANAISKFGASKQYTNRLIEPYMYVDYLVTSTTYDNFINQRDNYHAQLEMQIIARRLKLMLKYNEPEILKSGEWHLPFVTNEQFERHDIYDSIRMSVARCARTSYDTPDYLSKIDNDFKLFERLATDIHLSPFEHQVCAYGGNGGNLTGVTQLRKVLETHLLMNDELFSSQKFKSIVEELQKWESFS